MNLHRCLADEARGLQTESDELYRLVLCEEAVHALVRVGKAFGERWRKTHDFDANTFSSLGYDSTNIALEAMRRVGKPDGSEIQKMLKGGMKDFPIVQGPPGATAAFDEKGGVRFPMFIAVVKNGKRTLA